MKSSIKLIVFLLALSLAKCSLLEMSQTLWNKLLQGGLAKVGRLDPLRVPVVKVDQSEGDTSYRIVLKNVEIVGLNGSTLESIHIARGGLSSNLSELESGYVSYSDLRDVDTIKYKFHTVVNEQSENLAPAASNQEIRYERIPDDQQRSRTRQDSQRDYSHQSHHRVHYDPRDDSHPHRDDDRDRFHESRRDFGSSHSYRDDNRDRVHESHRDFGTSQHDSHRSSRPHQEHPRGYYREQPYQDNQQRREFVASANPNGGSFHMRGSKFQAEGKSEEGSRYPPGVQVIYAQSAIAAARQNQGEDVVDCPTGSCQRVKGNQQRFQQDEAEKFGSASERVETRIKNEKSKGFMDIVYTDKSNKSSKHFGNLRMYDQENARVYSFDDIMKDLRENKEFITHNFTEGESLKKRNDAYKKASESKRIRDMVRYAKDYQEKEGYFEEGMELVYHYGKMDESVGTRRPKRAHEKDEVDDNLMHVILKVRVPVLQLKSEYQLTGKVGKEILRGNGMMIGNFTELIGDFTIELKKVGNNGIVVRAARAKLQAKDNNVKLQGVNEKGPARSILNYGLMAAEAVAAMLADDLATKALSEKTADAMIYRMYKNVPSV